MTQTRLAAHIDRLWDETIVPTLVDYIRIPNKSPAFDPDWVAHGHMQKAVALFESWARDRLAAFPGATLEVVQPRGRTPVIFIELPGDSDATVLLYGHLDKQPEMKGWCEGSGPWTPVIKGDKLYGRGGADDGYAMFGGAFGAARAPTTRAVPRARAVILIEACEEMRQPRPSVLCRSSGRTARRTDARRLSRQSGCGNYEQLWLTTSLRGHAAGTSSVRVLEEGVHSGDASGIVPSSFRILRQLLSRLEDESTGTDAAEALRDDSGRARGAGRRRRRKSWATEVFTNSRSRRVCGPSLTSRRADPEPHLAAAARDHRHRRAARPKNAGNVLLPDTAAKLSLRLPPTLDAPTAGAVV